MTDPVEITASAYGALLAQAEREAPNECCGLLVGRGRHVLEVRPTGNLAPDPRTRFLVDPAAHFACIREARGRNLSVVGAYHSHPRGTAAPSATDVAQAFEDEQFIHVIVTPGSHTAPARVVPYVFRRGAFEALRLVVL